MENSSELKSAGLITGGLVIGGIYEAFLSPALLCTGSGQEEPQASFVPGQGSISAQTGTHTAVKTPVDLPETMLPRLRSW